jgi:O-antigen/teichoic acid export membrane protein
MMEIVKGTSISLPIKVLGTGLTFVFNLFLAHLIGASGTGLFFLALTVATIATIFGILGLENAMLKYAAVGASEEDWASVKGVYFQGMLTALVSSIASCIVVLGTASFIAETIFSKPELTQPLRWMSLAVVPMSLFLLHSAMLRSIMRITAGLFVFGTAMPLFALLLVYPLSFLGVNGAVMAQVGACTMTLFTGVFFWNRYTPQLHDVEPSFDYKRLMATSMPLFLVSANHLIMNWASTFSLGIVGSVEDVGIYRIAERTSIIMSFFLVAVNSVAGPKLTSLYAKEDMQAFAHIVQGSAKLSAFIASPLLIVFMLAPEFIMGLFGEEFRSGSSALTILAFGQYVNVAVGPVGLALIMSGCEKAMRNAVFAGALVSIIANACLTPFYGVVGAAWATSSGVVFLNLLCLYMVWRLLGVWPLPVGRAFAKRFSTFLALKKQ